MRSRISTNGEMIDFVLTSRDFTVSTPSRVVRLLVASVLVTRGWTRERASTVQHELFDLHAAEPEISDLLVEVGAVIVNLEMQGRLIW